MKSELDTVLDNLPRASDTVEGLGQGAHAYVYINDSGSLVILIDDIGSLELNERNLEYLTADAVI